MEIWQIIMIAIIAGVLATTLKPVRPDLALQISIVGGIIILFAVLAKLFSVIQFIDSFSARYGLDTQVLGIVLKIIGIAYLVEFGSQILKDGGESSLASKVELGGKVVILALSIPIITSLMDTIIRIMP